MRLILTIAILMLVACEPQTIDPVMLEAEKVKPLMVSCNGEKPQTMTQDEADEYLSTVMMFEHLCDIEKTTPDYSEEEINLIFGED